MWQFVQRVQSNTWRDISRYTKPSPSTVIEVTEKRRLEGEKLTNGTHTTPRSTPKIENPYHDDVAFARILDAFLTPAIKERAEEELELFAEAAVSEQVNDWIAEAERCPPQVQHWDAWGHDKSELVTSQGWKYLWQFGTSERLAALPSLSKDYESYGRMIQMLKCHLFAPSSATSGFYLALSDGVATLLSAHLGASKIDTATRALFQNAYDRLTSADEERAWTSGLWMTERGGGSDLTPTETTATYAPLAANDCSQDADGLPLGPWVLNGLKWFSTGTEAGMAIAVARTPKGLSAFLVPLRRTVLIDGVASTELNGVRIRRLKKKLGTRPLPTAELELDGMRGWLVGTEGKGIAEIGAVLNVSRIHLAVGVLGYAGRALSAARAFARVRQVARGTPLSSVPLHMKSLAKAHITYRAQMALAFFVTALLAKYEQPQFYAPAGFDVVPTSAQDTSCLLRLLGSVSKACASLEACHLAQVGVESLGGVGYLENDEMGINVARLWRDAAATPIGEGTTGVLATDVVKVMKGKIGSYVMAALGRWIKSSLPKKEAMAPEVAIVNQKWAELQTAIASHGLEYLTMNGREIMDAVCHLTCGVLLLADVARDDNPVAFEVARRWIRPATLLSGLTVEQELRVDQHIVFGDQPVWFGHV